MLCKCSVCNSYVNVRKGDVGQVRISVPTVQYKWAKMVKKGMKISNFEVMNVGIGLASEFRKNKFGPF